jgi:hypothetical protein
MPALFYIVLREEFRILPTPDVEILVKGSMVLGLLPKLATEQHIRALPAFV